MGDFDHIKIVIIYFKGNNSLQGLDINVLFSGLSILGYIFRYE